MATKSSFILLVFAVCIVADVSLDICPDYCICLLYNGRNLANCSFKHLANAYVDLPLEVEVLNLSHNDIMALENDCFKNYKHTIELILAHNYIQSIDFDTFSHLRLLESVDLSYNLLESFDNRIFELNRHLHSLNLAGNKFMSLSNVPIVISLPLRKVNLSNSQLNYLNTEFFNAIPQLQTLDLSHNLMIVFNLQALNKTTQLLELDVRENLWNCEHVSADFETLRSQDVSVYFDECEVKFQRMELLPNEEDIDMIDQKPKWRKVYNEVPEEYYVADDEQNCVGPLPTQCVRYEKCFLQLAGESQQSSLIFKDLESTSLQTLFEINLSFLVGLAAGIVSIMIILTAAFCFKACLEISTKKQRPTNLQNVASISDASSTPKVRRPRRARRRVAPQRAVVRQEQVYAPGTGSFMARLMGRQAHRAINQNTANLIRRLSRSSLFNNRLSQHFLDRSPVEANFTSYMDTEDPPPSYGEIVVMIDENIDVTPNTD